MLNRKPLSLFAMLLCLTCLVIFAELSLFFIHEHITSIFDIVTKTAIFNGKLNMAIGLPIVLFIAFQLCAFFVLILFICFIAEAVSLSIHAHQQKKRAYQIGILLWCLSMTLIFLLNSEQYPYSFFAPFFTNYLSWLKPIALILLVYVIIAYYYVITQKFKTVQALTFCLLSVLVAFDIAFDIPIPAFTSHATTTSLYVNKPNIIVIGIDSLRPDFISKDKTPTIINFLKQATTFTHAYTPLARTFPSWMSILTGDYPKHHAARVNLLETQTIIKQPNLAKHLRALGYETMYATDEKRFSHIDENYGFDVIIGPKMGVDDFILGSLTDFPLTNLLLQLNISRFLFPYNYANRAAAHTYNPEHFIYLIRDALKRKSNQPLFLGVHLCVSHWPYFKAGDTRLTEIKQADLYQNAVSAADHQLQTLLSLLKREHLLSNTILVLLSDHGTTLGLLGDRVISEKKYHGEPRKLKIIPQFRLDDETQRYNIATSYGQGTDVLSVKQYQILLAFRRYGEESQLPARKIATLVSLMDVAPSILSLAKLPPLNGVDGQARLFNASQDLERPLFFETADTIAEIESNHISIEEVLRARLHAYIINPRTTLLSINPQQVKEIIQLKQRAILWNHWLLAYYPASRKQVFVKRKNKLVLKVVDVPAFKVLVDIKTGDWSIALKHEGFPKDAPLAYLEREMQSFYGNEVLQT